MVFVLIRIYIADHLAHLKKIFYNYLSLAHYFIK